MTKRRTSRPASRQEPLPVRGADPRRGGHGPRGRWAVWALLAAVLVGGGWLAVRWRERSARRADPVAAMEPARAYQTALEMGGHGEHLESLPYYRRALDGSGNAWDVRRNYAAALNNATFEIWSRGGRASPASRASVERVAMTLASLDQLAAATQVAGTLPLRARLLVEGGSSYESWGLPYDALAIYLEAVGLDSTSSEARSAAGRVMAKLGVRRVPAVPG